MDLSLRLQCISDMMNKCTTMADIGTDHGYIPIYLIKKGICTKAIASDINKGPIEKARTNVRMKGLSDKVECRLGAGLSTIKKNEVEAVIIAGMGGNLIRDIIEEDLEKFKLLDYAIVQPVQNVEVFREYILSKGYEILDEAMCYDEDKFYQIFKIKYAENKEKVLDNKIFYEVSEKLSKEKDEITLSYIQHLIDKYQRICGSLKEDTENSKARKLELEEKIKSLKELL